MSLSSTPAVSIVMPVYNSADTLEMSIGSALGQTLETIELICVDDGSTDESRAVLQTFALSDPRLRVIGHRENRGAGAARNVGLDVAAGDYVFCMDADDEVPSGALEQLLSAARSSGCHLAIGKLDWRRSDSLASAPRPKSPGESLMSVAHVCDSALLQSVPGCHCCNLYSRELLDEHGLRYDVSLSLGEDQLFQASAIVHAGRVAIIEDVVYIYHHYRGTSVTLARPSLRNLVDDVEYQSRIAQLYLANGLGTAGEDYVRDWSYSIREYWKQIPQSLTRDEAGRFFTHFRAVMGDLAVTPWTESTPWDHQHLLRLVMDGRDDLALAFLSTGDPHPDQRLDWSLP
jgi:glycosyltransferase involved in cell wall biosynthesis